MIWPNSLFRRGRCAARAAPAAGAPHGHGGLRAGGQTGRHGEDPGAAPPAVAALRADPAAEGGHPAVLRGGRLLPQWPRPGFLPGPGAPQAAVELAGPRLRGLHDRRRPEGERGRQGPPGRDLPGPGHPRGRGRLGVLPPVAGARAHGPLARRVAHRRQPGDRARGGEIPGAPLGAAHVRSRAPGGSERALRGAGLGSAASHRLPHDHPGPRRSGDHRQRLDRLPRY